MIRTSTMIGTCALTGRNLSGLDHLISNGTFVQCVRWKRKPIWLPTAKSKLFRVPKRYPIIPEGEGLPIHTLYNNYKTYMNSLRSYLVATAMVKQDLTNAKAMELAESKDFDMCKAKNDAWNRECAAIRNTRLTMERERMKAFITQDLAENQKKDSEMKRSIEERVRHLKEESQHFITAENIDSAIDKALETIVDHNKALNMSGNFYPADKLIHNIMKKPDDSNKRDNLV